MNVIDFTYPSSWFKFSHCWIHVCCIQFCCSIWNQVGFIFLNGSIGSSWHLRCSHCHRSTPWGLFCIFGAKYPKGWKLFSQKLSLAKNELTSWFAHFKNTVLYDRYSKICREKKCVAWHFRLNVLTSLLNWIVAKSKHCFFHASSQKPLNFLKHTDFMS